MDDADGFRCSRPGMSVEARLCASRLSQLGARGSWRSRAAGRRRPRSPPSSLKQTVDFGRQLSRSISRATTVSGSQLRHADWTAARRRWAGGRGGTRGRPGARRPAPRRARTEKVLRDAGEEELERRRRGLHRRRAARARQRAPDAAAPTTRPARTAARAQTGSAATRCNAPGQRRSAAAARRTSPTHAGSVNTSARRQPRRESRWPSNGMSMRSVSSAKRSSGGCRRTAAARRRRRTPRPVQHVALEQRADPRPVRRERARPVRAEELGERATAAGESSLERLQDGRQRSGARRGAPRRGPDPRAWRASRRAGLEVAERAARRRVEEVGRVGAGALERPQGADVEVRDALAGRGDPGRWMPSPRGGRASARCCGAPSAARSRSARSRRPPARSGS